MSRTEFRDLLLYEDDHYMVINKPPYISTLEDRASDENLLEMAREYYPDAKACHRLDKETSGVLVFSRTDNAYRSLAIQFENRKVDKIYHAVVDGIHDLHNDLIEAPIRVSSGGTVTISRMGKPASTLVDVMETFRRHTLLRCKPITGRMHQIRAHLSFVGAPIVGDHQYKGEPLYLSSLKRNYNLKQGTEELPLIKRVALHASKIRFLDLNDSVLEVEAPYPKDFQVLLKQLRKFS